jgi:hypothetical protein
MRDWGWFLEEHGDFTAADATQQGSRLIDKIELLRVVMLAST